MTLHPHDIIRALSHAAILVDADGQIEAFNSAASDLLGGALSAGVMWGQLPLPSHVRVETAVLTGGIKLLHLKTPEDAAPRWTRMLQQALHHSNDAVSLTNNEMYFEYVNAAWEKITGYDRHEALGRQPRDLLRSDKHTTSYYRDIVKTAAQGGLWEGVVTSRRKDGADISTALRVCGPRDQDDKQLGFVAIRRDLSDQERRAQLERRLRHAERMAAVGQLAAGVAHEINNPLTYIIANLWYLAEHDFRKARSDAEAQEMATILKDTIDGAHRIASIVGDLKVFARHGDNQTLQPTSLVNVCHSAIKLAQNQLQHSARLVLNLQRANALASEERLVQVVLNLLVNAAQAVTAAAASDDHAILVDVFRDGDQSVISVRDTGCGMDPQTLNRIFEPFFTTKPMSGTGLGLSVSLGLVQEMGGRIDVASDPGKGSTFRVVLPAIDTPAPHPPLTTPSLPARPSLRILVIDDEERIGQSLKRHLRRDEVLIATSGNEALGFMQDDGEFDVILCDVMMPDMNGLEVHQEALARFPWLSQRFAFMTGGTFQAHVTQGLKHSKAQCFAKPLDFAALQSWLKAITPR